MKKTAFILIALFSFLFPFAQKPLSKQTIKDFATVCWYNYRYGNTMFISTMNTYLPYERSEVATLMENLEKDSKGREAVFEVFYKVSSGNYESLFNNLYRLKLTASQSKELATYIIAKQEKEEEGEIQEDRTTFFTGTKRFTDGDSWDYVVTINKEGNVTLRLYPNAKNTLYKDKTKPKKIITGKLQDGFVVTSSAATSSSFYFEDGKLLEANNEGGWNEYVMVNK